ncbi:MAG: hypothetical protein ATN31_07500 [Candidatus Epulonipiscioides saccharophilum]|nr:MAG: hypothetical protein ATN31_07500 [Epulopiscium sp. AS2M-Bin001]
MIYFDNAATTLKPHCVIEAVSSSLANTANSNRGMNYVSLLAASKIYATRVAISNFFNAPKANRVIFTSGATTSLNFALFGYLKPGDHVISTNLEHNSVLRPLYHLKKNGVELDIALADKHHYITPDIIKNLIKSNTKMVVMTHASNVLAHVQNIAEIGKLCRENNLLFVVDAAQTAGLVNIDMHSMHIDALCLSAHKSLLAPQGLGILCLSENINLEPILFGGTGSNTFERDMGTYYPDLLEAGTQNGPAIAGLNASLKYINDLGIDHLYSVCHELADTFERELRKFPNIVVHTDQQKFSAPIVTFTSDDSNDLSMRLSEEFDIITRSGGLCAPLVHDILGHNGLIRFSFSHFNTLDQVETTLDVLKKLL